MYLYGFSLPVGLLTAVNFLALAAGTASWPAPGGRSEAQAIIRRMEQKADKQRALLCGYSVRRSYTLHNKHLSHEARLTVLLTYNKNSGKTIKVISSDHVSGITRKAMLELVGAEPKSKGEGEENGTVDETNYTFALLGSETEEHRIAYHFKVTPKRPSRLLVDGEVWIDAKDYAVTRIRGRLSKSISFWLSRPDIEQDFTNFSGFWMPSYNRSVTYVRLAGEADLTIDYSDYRIDACSGPEQ